MGNTGNKEVQFSAVLATGRTALQFDGEDGGAYLRLALGENESEALCLLFLYLQQGGDLRAPMKVSIGIEGRDEPVGFIAQLVTGNTAIQFDGFDGSGTVRFLVSPDFGAEMVQLQRYGRRANLAVRVEVVSRDQISYQTPPEQE